MIGVNLIPSEVLIGHLAKRRIQRWAVTSALLAGAALVPVLMEGRQQAGFERLKLRASDTKAKLSVVRGQVATTAQAVADLDTELARARALRTKRSWSALLRLVGACLPEEVWLTSIATDPPQPSASGHVQVSRKGGEKSRKGGAQNQGAGDAAASGVVVLEAPTRIRLEGFALGHEVLYDLISGLKGSGSFSEVRLLRAGMEPVLQGHAVRFVLICEW